MVFHNQTNSIEFELNNLEQSLINIGYRNINLLKRRTTMDSLWNFESTEVNGEYQMPKHSSENFIDVDFKKPGGNSRLLVAK